MSDSERIPHTTPSNFEKKLLVYFNRYKSLDEIPNVVPRTQVAKVKNLFRIYACTAMMFTSLAGMGFVIYSAKQELKQGISVGKLSEEYHRQYTEQTASKK